jgi:hypothetical protein
MSITGNAEAAIIEWSARAIMQGLQLAFSLYVADRQFDLAQQYSDRAQQLLDRQLAQLDNDQGRWAGAGGPCLDGFLSEVCGVPVYTESYLDEAARTMATVRMAGATASKKIFECADVHCIGMTQFSINELAFKEAALATAAVQLAFRREEVDTERKNAIRLANKAQGIAMAKGSMNGSSAGLASLAGQYAAMANKAGDGLSSSLQSIGFQAQSLATTFARNPFSGGNADPSRTTVATEAQTAANGSSFANTFAAYQVPTVGVDTASSGISSASGATAGTWGSNPSDGMLGSDGSQAGSAGNNSSAADTTQADAYWSGNDGWNY